jgi:hypothetical protein
VRSSNGRIGERGWKAMGDRLQPLSYLNKVETIIGKLEPENREQTSVNIPL